MVKKANLTAILIEGVILVLIAGFSAQAPLPSMKTPCADCTGSQNQSSTQKDDYVFEKIDPVYLETNVQSLITIKNENDITNKRNKLIQYIWSGKGFPSSRMPAKIEKDTKDIDLKLFNCEKIENLKSIDKLTVSMDYGMNSIIYFFHPIRSNGKLLIYQQGHRDEYLAEENTLPVTVEKGYSVITLLMPLMGLNNKPVVDIPYLGKLKLLTHNYLIELKSEKLSPIKFFMEPVAVALNYALGNYKFDSIFMTGISGGGWTTTLYAALDPRILRSYPTAGTLPTFMRIERDWGDWEQYEPELYRIANFLDLYILGSYGDNRKQYQILNKYDSCCFAGIKYQVYEKDVKDAVARLGKGSFHIYLDDSHKSHKISDASLKVILKDIESVR